MGQWLRATARQGCLYQQAGVEHLEDRCDVANHPESAHKGRMQFEPFQFTCAPLEQAGLQQGNAHQWHNSQ